jgi:acetolactate synthase-1/2/3 large subunit
VLTQNAQIVEERDLPAEPQEHLRLDRQIGQWKKDYPLTYQKNDTVKPIRHRKVFELTKGKVIITTEVGQNQM